MKRQWIAGMMTASLLISGSAWGQQLVLPLVDPETGKPVAPPSQSVVVAMDPVIVVPCKQWDTYVPPGEWATLTDQQRAAACVQSAPLSSMSSRYPLTPLETKKIRSQGLAIVGLVSMIAGAITALPQGETVEVLGDAYCVNTSPAYGNASVDYGACSKGPTARMIGSLMMLGGGVAMIIGMQDVPVSPMVSPHAVGVSKTIHWGAKR